jgi:LacI family transcriptional regulator
MKGKSPAVVVLASKYHQSLRDMLSGVFEYARGHGPWNIYPIDKPRWNKSFWRWEKWGADGVVVGDSMSAVEARRVVRTGLPIVTLNLPHEMRVPSHPLAKASCCIWDSDACGRMAARYFIDRGYRHFAFVDYPVYETYWAQEREVGFHAEIKEAFTSLASQPPTSNAHCAVPSYHRYGRVTARERDDWMVERPRLARWLRALPKPCAVLAPNDRRALQVSDACRTEGIPVPGEIALLGVDDERWFCEASVPTISSVRCLTRKAGWHIAEHLDRLMRGEKIPRTEFLVEPVSVVTRQSTDWMAVADEKVAIALKGIADSYADPDFSIARLARMTGIARRTLEIRFRNATGRTIHEELDRVRLSRIVSLLKKGNVPRARLAALSGYRSLSALDRAIKAAGIQS